MIDDNTNEATIEDQTDAGDAEGVEDQLQPEDSEQLDQSDQSFQVPAKFADKSRVEILQSYAELEKANGKVSSELGQLRKEKEERDAGLQNQSVDPFQFETPIPQPLPQAQTPQDPFEGFEEEYESNPAKAMKSLHQRQQSQTDDAQIRQQVEARAFQATQYMNQLSTDSDFQRRIPQMRQATMEYYQIIRPEFLNSPQALKLLNEVSQGRDRGFYEKQAVTSSQKEKKQNLREKRSAKAETSHSEGDSGTVDIRKLSTAEMEKHFGFTEDE